MTYIAWNPLENFVLGARSIEVVFRASSRNPFKCQLGLQSLRDMINCHVSSLVHLESELVMQTQLGRQILRPRRMDEHPDDPISEETRARMLGWIELAHKTIDEFEMNALSGRVQRFEKKLNSGPLSHTDYFYQVSVMKEALEDDLKGHVIYRYPNDKAKFLLNWKQDWEPVLDRFGECAGDIRSAIDLWALSHNTASVFQFMRVLEVGLGSLAKDVGVNYDTQAWYNVINEIEKAIKTEAQKKKSPIKEKRMQFLSEAAKEFSYFKDGWRNYVSHNKCEYDDLQAQSVMEHVRQFMTTLAKNLPVQDEQL